MNPSPTKMMAYVINLDRSPERLERIRRRLDELGIPWRRITAVDGSALQKPYHNYNETLYRYLHGKTTNPGELGCYFSHLKAMDAVLEDGTEVALILEDDINLPDNLLEVIHKAIEHRRNWDILKLHGFHRGHHKILQSWATGMNLCVPTTSYTGSAAYLIQNTSVQTLRHRIKTMILPYDHVFDNPFSSGLKIRNIQPKPCELNESAKQSTITPDSIKKNFKIKGLPRLTSLVFRAVNSVAKFVYFNVEFILKR